MKGFGEYLNGLDPIQRTNYVPGGASFFTGKLVKDAATKEGSIFVAEFNDNVIGFIGGYIHKQTKEELKEIKKAKVGVISEFYIADNFRKQGVGRQLLQKMEDYFRSQNCTVINIELFALNSLARNFYSRHNYQDRSLIVSKNI